MIYGRCLSKLSSIHYGGAYLLSVAWCNMFVDKLSEAPEQFRRVERVEFFQNCELIISNLLKVIYELLILT